MIFFSTSLVFGILILHEKKKHIKIKVLKHFFEHQNFFIATFFATKKKDISFFFFCLKKMF